jgi:nicotinate-nucleotide pyrophosphorylase (carboxylating)
MNSSCPVLARQILWEDLSAIHLRQLIQLAKEEDVPVGQKDVTTETFPSATKQAVASLIARQDLVVSGLKLIPLILEAYEARVSFKESTKDGDLTTSGALIGQFSGDPIALLTAERIILNFLQHLSGVATLTETFVRAMGETSTRLLDTRKTTPGYRLLEKYAVTCGGGWNHRLGLHDRVLIKDNHLHAFKAQDGEPLQLALKAARQKNPELPIQIEVDNLSQLRNALKAKPDCILLDNFTPDEIRDAVEIIDGQCASEASGGITLETLPDYSHLGLDFISTGATVHQSQWVDIGLDWED